MKKRSKRVKMKEELFEPNLTSFLQIKTENCQKKTLNRPLRTNNQKVHLIRPLRPPKTSNRNRDKK